jgi:hypothetical protein
MIFLLQGIHFSIVPFGTYLQIYTDQYIIARD